MTIQNTPKPVQSGPEPAISGSLHMKKRTTSATSTAKSGRTTAAGFGNSALDLIIKEAYRRHSRGRIARAAMASCLGI